MSLRVSSGPVAVLYPPSSVEVPGALVLLNNAEHEVPALPPSFPAAVGGELVWGGADVVSDSTFVHKLTDADKDEIARGLAHFKGK